MGIVGVEFVIRNSGMEKLLALPFTAGTLEVNLFA
jgi:hypothetical protein